MIFFGLYTNWKRIHFDKDFDKVKRQEAEGETNQDIQKPIQQILCDVHEEANENRDPVENLMHQNKRLTSMMARVSLSNERHSMVILFLTFVIIALTIYSIFYPREMVINPKGNEPSKQEPVGIDSSIVHRDATISSKSLEIVRTAKERLLLQELSSRSNGSNTRGGIS